MSLPVQVAGTGGARIPMGAVETAPTGHGAEVAEAASALSTALGQASPDGGLDAQRLIDETGRQVRSTDERIRDVQTSMQRDLDSMDALSRQQSGSGAIRPKHNTPLAVVYNIASDGPSSGRLLRAIQSQMSFLSGSRPPGQTGLRSQRQQ